MELCPRGLLVGIEASFELGNIWETPKTTPEGILYFF